MLRSLNSSKLRSFQFKNSSGFLDELLLVKTPLEAQSKDKSKKLSKSAGLGDLELVFEGVRDLDLSNCSKVCSVPPELKSIRNLVLIGSSIKDEVRHFAPTG
jgi:hypothetical protein